MSLLTLRAPSVELRSSEQQAGFGGDHDTGVAAAHGGDVIGSDSMTKRSPASLRRRIEDRIMRFLVTPSAAGTSTTPRRTGK